MLSLLILVPVLALSFLYSSVSIWLGARWFKAERATYGRALMTYGCLLLLAVPITVGANSVGSGPPNSDRLQRLGVVIALVLTQHLAMWGVLARMLKTTYFRAMGVWLVMLAFTGAAIGVTLLTLRPFVLEAFVMPTGSMSPTVLGWHKVGVCPLCGGPLIAMVPEPGDVDPVHLQGVEPAICAKCLKASEVLTFAAPTVGPDRFVANKLLKPRRWDLVAFRPPNHPSEIFLKRLVGFPGETLYSQKGAIFINGVQATLPSSLTGLQYEIYPGFGRSPASEGTPENPWRIGPGQYWLLGDFSQVSADSRIFGPVPAANIIGVADVTYWPISRFKIHR